MLSVVGWNETKIQNFVSFQASAHPWNKTETKHWNSPKQYLDVCTTWNWNKTKLLKVAETTPPTVGSLFHDVRRALHIKWLLKSTVPVWLNVDYMTNFWSLTNAWWTVVGLSQFVHVTLQMWGPCLLSCISTSVKREQWMHEAIV